MCEPASIVLTKDNAYFSMSSDSHSAICAENGLKEEANPTIINTLRVEITPNDRDFTSDPSTWTCFFDQDIKPTWFDEVDDEARARRALTGWIAARVFKDGFHAISSGRYFAAGRGTSIELTDKAAAVIRKGARAKLFENAGVTAYDDCSVKALDRCDVSLRDKAEAELWYSARVSLHDGSIATLWNRSHAEACGESEVNANDYSTVTAYDDAKVTAIDHTTISIYDRAKASATGESTVHAYDNTIVCASGDSRVFAMNGAVMHLSGNAIGIILDGIVEYTLSGNAVCIDRRGGKSIVLTA